MALDLDLGGFSDDKFDSKKWVNSVCKALGVGKDGDEVQKLSDLEMKLQLMAGDISAALEEQRAPAIMRVPRANRDIFRLREDAIALRSSLSSAMQSLSLSTVHECIS